MSEATLALNRQIRDLIEKNVRLRAALKKAHLALHNDGTQNAFTISSLHGFPYTGPVFTEDEYRKAIQGDG